MDTNTGEIRLFDTNIPGGWKELKVGELVVHNDLNFEIESIDVENQRVVLKPISLAAASQKKLFDAAHEFAQKIKCPPLTKEDERKRADGLADIVKRLLLMLGDESYYHSDYQKEGFRRAKQALKDYTHRISVFAVLF